MKYGEGATDLDPEVNLYRWSAGGNGGNRTGRIFTGDRSGDWLTARFTKSIRKSETFNFKDDGMRLSGTYIGAAVRCARRGTNRRISELRASD
jgi:hypothetical protein